MIEWITAAAVAVAAFLFARRRRLGGDIVDDQDTPFNEVPPIRLAEAPELPDVEPSVPTEREADPERVPVEPVDEPAVTLHLDDLFEREGGVNRLDPLLLKAIATVESALNVRAMNPADPSFGVMQLLCIDDGHGSCSNRLPAVPFWPPESRAQLMDPSYNVRVGAAILAANLRDRSGDIAWAIASYNSFRAFKEGRDLDGNFRNESYVERVRRAYRALGGQLVF